jgi:hypothetical protein
MPAATISSEAPKRRYIKTVLWSPETFHIISRDAVDTEFMVCSYLIGNNRLTPEIGLFQEPEQKSFKTFCNRNYGFLP